MAHLMLKKAKILGIKIDQSSKNDLLQYASDYLAQKTATRPLTIFTPNPEQVVFAYEHPWFKEVLNSADVALPDGEGIVWAAKEDFLSGSLPKMRIPGIEFMEELVKLAAEKNYSIALIGGRGGVAEKALKVLQKRHSGLKVWAEEPPIFRFKNDDLRFTNEKAENIHKSLFINHKSESETEDYIKQLAERVGKNGVKLVFVGLGAPKQEYFIAQLARQFQISNFKFQIVLMSVGGSFDIISGKISRSPTWLQNLGLEWIWRLLKEPWRFGRQLQLLKFVWLILKERFMVKSK